MNLHLPGVLELLLEVDSVQRERSLDRTQLGCVPVVGNDVGEFPEQVRDAEPFRLQRLGANVGDVVLQVRVGGDQLSDVALRAGDTYLACGGDMADIGIGDEG